ncbi:MAG: phosphoribosylglycinamide formyltransferase [Candidatus Dormibacteraeota bacterium]|nr:phosphoribosylglycinamide formyltransferase [Candidatus Dormibacteraeota bacterium]
MSGLKVGVLASGRGSNLRNLVERGFDVVAVATNRPTCGAADFARARGLALGEFPQRAFGSARDRDEAMRRWMEARGAEVAVCAGYDRVLTPAFWQAFAGPVINLHPSLLPAFAGGMDAVARALAQGVKVSGCTVHLVTGEVDGGPILAQAAVPVAAGDTPESLLARIHAEEWRILPEVLEALAQSAPVRQ